MNQINFVEDIFSSLVLANSTCGCIHLQGSTLYIASTKIDITEPIPK